MTGCYYRRVDTAGEYVGVPPACGGVFDSTDFTRSNWGANLQHGSPPLALLTRAVEGLLAGSGLRIGRLSLDILGAIGVQRVRVRAQVARPGSRIRLLTAEMADDANDRVLARLSAWALAVTDTRDVATDRHPPLIEGPAHPIPSWFEGASGYFDSVRWRHQQQGPDGVAAAWLRPVVHLVDTDETTPLQRLAMVADCANGVGAALDPEQFIFMNTDTVVHLHRLPSGVDFGLQARASIGPDGIGVTTAEFFDRTGFIGTSAQTLLVQRR